MEKADMLISVPLEKFGSMQYNRADELIKAWLRCGGIQGRAPQNS